MAVSGAQKRALGLGALESESIYPRLRVRHGLRTILRPIFQIEFTLSDVINKICAP